MKNRTLKSNRIANPVLGFGWYNNTRNSKVNKQARREITINKN